MGGNRKERRAAGQKSSRNGATSSGAAFQPTTEIDEDGIEYILQHPDRSGPKGKTLFDLAEERQKELNKGKPTKWSIDSDNTPAGERPFDDEPLGPFGDAVLYSLSMAVLHLTLDVLVYSQYREDVIWGEIIKRAASALPIFFFLVYFTHTEMAYRFPTTRNLLFLIGGTAAGCFLVYSGNTGGYFYVMKSAPPVASLWVWSVIEMNLSSSALCAATVLGYSWWNDFSFF